ncbi:50S ribosomal protein L32 [Actinopolymorpha sp. B17G11]|uniref:50S ribosomal protein L32 n=1 Tax=unclassified Actinopolymorpha TaxID=2627063 RepID=UPI0032D95DB9
MQEPKRKKSRSRTRSRRAQWKAKPPALVVCGNSACRLLTHVARPWLREQGE